MAKSIPALITPEVLTWARNLDGYSVQEVATKLRVTQDKITEWENGESYPTLLQAKKLAQVFHIPFVYFYLPDTPKKVKRIQQTDYRTFGNIGDRFFMSHELSWLLRDVEDRRETMLALYETEQRQPKSFPIILSAETIDTDIAYSIRNLLCLSFDKQLTFRKPEVALNYCIKVLEKNDVLVFQAAGIHPKEMRGFSMAYEQMPIIVLNRKDEPSARLFTLRHALAHVVTRTSGICNNISLESKGLGQWEIRCNRIAGSVLVPKEHFEQHSVVQEINNKGFDDEKVAAIARDYAVSREVILHCLLDCNIITKEFYFQTLKKYEAEYLAHKKANTDGFLPPALNVGTQVGKLYAQTMLTAFNDDHISARDASNYLLNLRVSNFRKLEGWCFR